MRESALGPVAILGGTGPLGRSLAMRFAAAGLKVQIGSRDAHRAEEAALAVGEFAARGGSCGGAANSAVARAAGIAIVSVPYQSTVALLADLAQDLAGKVVVSTGVPMEFRDGVASRAPVEAGSVAEQVAGLLPESRVVGAFHTVSARSLARMRELLDEDVLVTGDHPEAVAAVAEMVRLIPNLRPVLAGPLSASSYPEGMTPFLLQLNRRYRAHAGLRITGIPDGSASDVDRHPV